MQNNTKEGSFALLLLLLLLLELLFVVVNHPFQNLSNAHTLQKINFSIHNIRVSIPQKRQIRQINPNIWDTRGSELKGGVKEEKEREERRRERRREKEREKKREEERERERERERGREREPHEGRYGRL